MKQIKTWALLSFATFCVSTNVFAQTTIPWIIKEGTESYPTQVNLCSSCILNLGGLPSLSFNMNPQDYESIVNLDFSKYYTSKNTNIFRAIDPNALYDVCYLTQEGNLYLGGTSFNVRGFSITDDRDNGCWYINSMHDFGSAGVLTNYPLKFSASQYNFLIGNVSTEGILMVGRAAGNQALINADCFMTGYKYLLQLSNYGHNQFSVDENGNVKAGKNFEMGALTGGHFLIQSTDAEGTIISNESNGNQFSPFTVNASTFTFNINGKDTCFNIKGGGLNVDGEINCKGKMTVAEINSDQINTKDIKVEMNNTADYVFDENYELKSLNDVEAYIKNEKHLPGVPSASEMEKEGMSVSKMSNLLLEKVEELTLHMIEMQKQIDELKTENKILKEGNK